MVNATMETRTRSTDDGRRSMYARLGDWVERKEQKRQSLLAGRLFSAVYHRDAKKVRMLLERGADANARNSSEGVTALMLAASYGGIDIAKMLLEKGADVNAKNAYVQDSTALIRAARYGHLKMVEMLLEKGADVNAKHVDGAAALDVATEPSIRRLLEAASKGKALQETVLSSPVMLEITKASGEKVQVEDAVRIVPLLRSVPYEKAAEKAAPEKSKSATC